MIKCNLPLWTIQAMALLLMVKELAKEIQSLYKMETY